jgi:RNA polymerase sigma-70 factor (ECF subfamily)
LFLLSVPNNASHGHVPGLVSRFEGKLILYAQRLLAGDLAGARDVVQETFLRLCRTPWTEIAGHEAAWLYTVCRRLALDIRRKEKRMTLMTEESADRLAANDVDPAEQLEQSDSAQHIMRMLERLPENQKEAIVLKFGHGLSYNQIAEVTGHSVSNVGFLIHAGLKAIRGLVTA